MIYILVESNLRISILKDWKSPIETLMLETSGNPLALAGGYFMNVCPKCNAEMNLSRVEINRLKQLIAQERGAMFFLSDETVQLIVHNFHTKKDCQNETV